MTLLQDSATNKPTQRIIELKKRMLDESRYLSIEHKLLFLYGGQALHEKIDGKLPSMYMRSAAVFIWTAIPYRSEWRFTLVAPKMIAQESGHICQNLYLACEAIGAGTCAVGGYSQKQMDDLLGVDGEEEFTIYVAPVGKILTRE